MSADAGADSPLRGAISAPAVSIDGCTRDQESVARMMARLRTVSGVTRVSLAKSNKPDDTQGGTTDSAAPAVGGAEVAGCSGKGKDIAPEFQVVVFFEDDARPRPRRPPRRRRARRPPPQDAATASATPQPASGAERPRTSASTPVSNSEGAE